MADRKRSGAAPAAPAAPPTATTAGIIEPPKRHRIRTSTVPDAVVDGMVALVNDGQWATALLDDGSPILYATQKDASNASVVHRRALIRAFDGDPNGKDDPIRKRVRSQVWETKNDDGTKTGKWVFALAMDPAPAEDGNATG